MESKHSRFYAEPHSSSESVYKRRAEKSQECSKTKRLKTDEETYGRQQCNFESFMKPEDIHELHKSIDYDEIDSVEDIIRKYPLGGYAYNDDHQSAVAAALTFVRPPIYELLITNGFKLGPHEDFIKIMQFVSKEMPQLKKENNQKIFEIHQKCAVESNLEYLLKIRSKCRLHHATPKEKRCEYFWKIMTTLKELNEISHVSILLQILALCPRLRIIFDFSRDSVDAIDPKKDQNVRGSTHSSAFCITIGAKLLLEKRNRFEVYGTMAHEFCHYALEFVFANDCKPYAIDDEETKKEFEAIVDDYSQRKITEAIVVFAFGNSEGKWHAELIVRVPHLLAFYKGADEIIEELRNKFCELFKFYDKLVPELERRTSVMKVEFEVKEINDICGLSTKLQKSVFNLNDDAIDKFQIDFESNDSQVFHSNCVELTLKSICEKAKRLKKLKFLIFARFENLENELISKHIHEALEKHENVVMIINHDETDKKVSKRVQETLGRFPKNRKIVLVTTQNLKINAFGNEKITHLLSELSVVSQKELLKFVVNFQGSKIELNEIWSKNLELIETFPFDKILNGDEVKIGDKINFKGVHLERKFGYTHEFWNWKEAEFSFNPLSTNEIISEINSLKMLVLSDVPGNGKSTEFKFLTMKLKRKFQNYWILLIDLKLHTKSFKKDSDILANYFDSVEKISDFLALKIFKLKTFEAEIFSELFKNDRVVVLMDGVDEISPSYKNFVMELAVGIRKNSKNQLWIATRPHLMKELEEKLETTAWVLTNFTNDDRKIFFKKVFKKHNLNFENFYEKIENFLNEVEKERFWGDMSNQRVTNPLLLHMVAELFIDDSNFQLQNSNLFKIYDEFVKKMFKRLLKKGSEAGNDATEFMTKINIQEFHKKKAIENMFEKMKLKNLFQNLPQPSDDQLNRIGLMFNDGGDNFNFIHETFKEFLIAQTIFEKIFELKFQSEAELNETLEIMLKMMKNEYDEYKVVLMLLDSSVENFAGNQNCEKSKLILAKIKKTKNLKFKKSAEFGCNNLIKILSQFIDDKGKVLNLWMEFDWYGNTIETAFKFQTLEKMQDIWSFAEKCFTECQTKALMTLNCFSAAIQNNDERTFEFFLQLKDDKLNQDEKDTLMNNSSIDWTYICERENVKLVLSRLKKFFPNQFKDYLKTLKDDIKTFDRACGHQNPESIKFLCGEIIENFGYSAILNVLRRTDQLCRNVLMSAAEINRHPKVFETLINVIEDKNEIKELLQQEDIIGKNALMNAIYARGKTELTQKVLKAYEHYFQIEELKNILVRKNRRQENVLDIAASWKFDRFKLIYGVMEKMFNPEDMKKLLIKSLGFIHQFNLLEFIPFIVESLSVDESQTIFPVCMQAATSMQEYEIRKLLLLVDSQIGFADSFYKKLFEYIDASNKTIIDYAKENQNEKVFEILNEKKTRSNAN